MISRRAVSMERLFRAPLTHRRFCVALALLGSLALGLRLTHLWLVLRALGEAQIHDAAYYHDVAMALLGERDAAGPSTDVAFANVGYPHLLRWLYVWYPTPTSALIMQCFLGAATTGLAGLVARDCFGSRRVGLGAAGLTAIYAPGLFYDGLLLIPSVSAFLFALLCWSVLRAVERASWGWAAAAGLAIGASALLRSSQLLLVLPALFAVLPLRFAVSRVRLRWRRAKSPTRAGSMCTRLGMAAALCLATAACVSPLLVQQWQAGAALPLTANGGMNFWIGNQPGADGRHARAPFLDVSKGGDFRHTILVERDGFLAEARKRSANENLTLAAADAFWWRETLREIAAAPATWLGVVGKKLLATVNGYEPRTNASFDLHQELSPLLRHNPLRFGLLWVLAVVGAVQLRSKRDRRAARRLGSLAFVPLFTCVAFFVSGEYRHAAFPALVPFAALGLHRLELRASLVARQRALVRTRTAAVKRLARWWPAAGAVLTAAALAFAPTARLGPTRDRKAYAEALASPTAPNVLPTVHRYQLAEALLVRHGSTFEDRVLSAEARLLVQSNWAIQFQDLAAARQLIETAEALWQVELVPGEQFDVATIERIRSNLVRRVAQLARQPFVRQWPEVDSELTRLGGHGWREAVRLLQQGELERAGAFLDGALAVAPSSSLLLAYRGQLAALRGNDPTPWLTRSLEAYPRIALPVSLLAQHALRNRDHRGALAVLISAVRERPYSESLHYALGNLMLEHGPAEDVIGFFTDEALRDEKPQTSHYFIALGLEKLGRHSEAIAQLKTALAIDPAHEMSQRAWGLILQRQGDLVAALEHLVEATRIHPEFRPALEDVARLAERLGHPREAADWRARAAVANPRTERRFVYWAKYLHEHGRHSAALTELARRLTAAPGDVEALVLRRAIQNAEGHADDADTLATSSFAGTWEREPDLGLAASLLPNP